MFLIDICLCSETHVVFFFCCCFEILTFAESLNVSIMSALTLASLPYLAWFEFDLFPDDEWNMVGLH